jgi:ABC-type branched-subunit amino acid transport system substrate-binding protein
VSALHAGACLSLSGRFAPFGRQTADGLRLWADTADADLTVVDDESDPKVLAERLPDLARRVDLLFGPYSTVLMRAAVPIAAAAGRLLFNHGGSGNTPGPVGQVVDVLTPASRYALPFIAALAGTERAPLYTAVRRGTFGRNVAAGAVEAAQRAGIEVRTLDPEDPPRGTWDLLAAGVYEDDVATVRAARSLTNPPRLLCSVAAGVARFAGDVEDPDGIYGIGQWAPGAGAAANAGMGEVEFLRQWATRFNETPDYPGVQAYAAGVIAQCCAEMAGTTDADALWQAADWLELRTVFGRFALDTATGEQVGHEAVLTRWHGGRQHLVSVG